MTASGVLQTPNGGGSQEVSRSSLDRRGHLKPHRPGKYGKVAVCGETDFLNVEPDAPASLLLFNELARF